MLKSSSALFKSSSLFSFSFVFSSAIQVQVLFSILLSSQLSVKLFSSSFVFSSVFQVQVLFHTISSIISHNQKSSIHFQSTLLLVKSHKGHLSIFGLSFKYSVQL